MGIFVSYWIEILILILRVLRLSIVDNQTVLWIYLISALYGQFRIQNFKEKRKVIVLNVIYGVGAFIQLYLFFDISISLFVCIEIVLMGIIAVYLHVEIV